MGGKRYVTTLITAAEETNLLWALFKISDLHPHLFYMGVPPGPVPHLVTCRYG